MGDDNDVIFVESDERTKSKSPTQLDPNRSRPIMQIFLDIITNNNKHIIVVTNRQITEILQKEFDMDIQKLHKLEVNIYRNVVKRFLKEWPQWDDLNHKIYKLKKRNSLDKLDSTLEQKYVCLKDYLKEIIDKTKPLASETVNKMLQENIEMMKNIDTSDIVLEISCTRKQINELIYDRPLPINNSIFNFSSGEPSQTLVSDIPIESILNWWGIKISIDLKFFNYSRSTQHQLKHTLVNKHNGPRDINETFNQTVQIMKKKPGPRLLVNKHKVLESLDKIQEHSLTINSRILKVIFDLIKHDLTPISPDIQVPGKYRQHSSKHPYYRQLKKELDVPGISALGNNFDLYLEEKITPMHVFHFGNVSPGPYTLLFTTGLEIECVECRVTFSDSEVFHKIKEHFKQCHSNEPDWTCTNCGKIFTMLYLTGTCWKHECESD